MLHHQVWLVHCQAFYRTEREFRHFQGMHRFLFMNFDAAVLAMQTVFHHPPPNNFSEKAAPDCYKMGWFCSLYSLLKTISLFTQRHITQDLAFYGQWMHAHMPGS